MPRDPEVRALWDKVVIVGVAYGGSNDVHLTPLRARPVCVAMDAWSGNPGTGGRRTARRTFRRVLPNGGRALLIGVILLIGAAGWQRLPSAAALLLLALLAVIVIGGHSHIDNG